MKVIKTILLLLLPSLLIAQEQFYNILNEDNGLLSNEVYDIHFSKEGFLYITGDRGIQKYDGTKLEHILPSRNKSVSWVKDDDYGGIIFQSFDGRYWRYANDSTKLILNNGSEISRSKQYSIFQGRYVVMCGNADLYLYDLMEAKLDTLNIHSFKNKSRGLKEMEIVGCDNEWIYGKILDTLFYQVNRNGKLNFLSIKQVGSTHNIIAQIKLNDNFYFLSRRDRVGRNQYLDVSQVRNGALQLDYSLGPIVDKYAMNTVRVNKGKSYLITHDGYWELNSKFQKKHKEAKLPKIAITQIAEDAKGGLYISTLTHGVFYKPKLAIKNVSSQFNKQPVKAFDDNMASLYYLNDKGVLFNKQKPIREVAPSTFNKFSKHKSDQNSVMVYGSQATPNTFSLYDNKWYGNDVTSSTKINGWFQKGKIYAAGTSYFTLLFSNKTEMKDFSKKYISSRPSDDFDRRIYNPVQRQWKKYASLLIRKKRAFDYLYHAQSKSFYVAYADSFYHYYPENKLRVIKGNKTFEQKYKNADLEVRYLYQMNQKLWAGGLRGLMLIDNDSIKQYYDDASGLPFTRIEFMKGFGDTILLGFPKAVSLFSEEDGVFQTYNSTTYFANASIKSAHIFKGQLYVSTTKGVFKLPIQERGKTMPRAFIRYVKANNERWDVYQKIPFSKNDISIRVNGLDMSNGGSFNYFYRLNKNKKWTKQSNAEYDIRFNALLEGVYNFEFKVVNQKGEESDIQQVSFEIAPPFIRSWIFYLLAFLIVSGSVAFIFWRRGKAMQRKAEFDKQVKQSEITAIKAQMNPHFIFNALNSIQNWIVTNDVKNSNVYLGKFSDLVRKTLEASENNVLLLSKEVELIQLYLDLENLRFGEEIAIQFDIKVSDEEKEEIFIPTLLIQPYIENVFKHGLLHKNTGRKQLRILLEKQNGKLHCEIEDNGVGRERAQAFSNRNKKYKSFSSNANRKRIDLLNEMFDNQITLDIQDAFPSEDDCGTRVVLSLPIIDYDSAIVNK